MRYSPFKCAHFVQKVYVYLRISKAQVSKTYHENLLIRKFTHVYLRSHDKLTNVRKSCIYVNYSPFKCAHFVKKVYLYLRISKAQVSKTYHENLLISKLTHVYLRSHDKLTNVRKSCIYVNNTYVSKFAHVKVL